MEKLNARVEKCVKKYGTDSKNGLTDEKVEENRRLYGKNEVSAVKGKTLFRRIIDALFDPMLVILEFAGIVTFGVNLGKAIKSGDGNFYECLGILCSVILSVARKGDKKRKRRLRVQRRNSGRRFNQVRKRR